MIQSLIFITLNSLAPGSGLFYYRTKINAGIYFFCFILFQALFFYTPIMPVANALGFVILSWVFNLAISLCLGLFIEKNKNQRPIWKNLLGVFLILVLTWIFFIGSFNLGRIRFIRVISHSMSPSLENGDILLTERSLYSPADLKNGDIVIFENPVNKGMYMVKRVIGLAGADVKTTKLLVDYPGNKEVLIRPLTEKIMLVSNGQFQYALNFAGPTPESLDIKSKHIPKDHFYAIGDNRLRSIDCRSFGPVPNSNILGIGAKLLISNSKGISLSLSSFL